MRIIESVSLDDVKTSLQELLAGKLSESKVQLNIDALRRGYEEVQVSPKFASHPKQMPGSKGRIDRPALKMYDELIIAGIISPENREENHTGGWRQQKPIFDEALCVNCLLCWINCPEPAILTEDQKMRGYDYRYCKGCGICYTSCPSGAISMVPEAQDVPPRGRVAERSRL